LYARTSRSLAIIIPAIGLIYALFSGLRTVGDPDLGWQLATGRWIVQHRTIPFTDVLSYTAVGHEWVYPVLSQLIFYWLYLLGGYSLLSWWSAAACVATTAVLLRGNTITRCLAVLAVPLIAVHTAPRAEMFTHLLFVVFVSVLWHHYRSGRAPLWSLPPVMFLWVNLHLGFVSGLGMCAAYVFLELSDMLVAKRRPVALSRLRAAAPWLLATIGATLLNPWGPRNYVGMVRLLPVKSSSLIAELRGVPVTSGDIAQVFAWRDPRSTFWWLLLISIVAVLVAASNRRFALAVLLGASIGLVFHAIRFQGLFAAVVVVIGGAVLGDGIEIAWVRRLWQRVQPATSNFRPVLVVLAVIMLTAFVGVRVWDLAANLYYLRTPYQFSLFGPGESRWYPEDAATFLKREQLPRNVFNDYNVGGFASWRLLPEYPDYVDGRGDLFRGEILSRSLELVQESLDSPQWQQEASSRNINTIMVSVDHGLGQGLSGLEKFCASERWRPVYLDNHAALFVRLTPDTAGLISRLQIDCNKTKFDSPPPSNGNRGRAERFDYYLNAAAILVVLNRNLEALDALEQAERIFSENAFLHYAKGTALQSIGHWPEAELELRTSIKLDSDDAPFALARLYDQEGRYVDEAAVLSRAAEQSPQPHWLYVKLGYAQLALGLPRLALHSFDLAEKASPFGNEATELGTSFQAQIAEGRRRARQDLK
jgi:tetratricopeptide (TPR) repeat protein